MKIHGISRRTFFKSIGLSSLLLNLDFLCANSTGLAQQLQYQYRGWEDIYRKKWTWDRIVKSSHAVNCWHGAGCIFDVYVKDGLVFREEQAADYPQINPELSDFNPRGCQKGCCFSTRMYFPGRIKYPLKRVGERGEGRWKRISWDEALTEIADAFIDTMVEDGPDTIAWDTGTNFSFGIGLAALIRWLLLFDNYNIVVADTSDDCQGSSITFGKPFMASSVDDWFYSQIFLIWGGNPAYTNIPVYHFLQEARYNGTKVIAITPDYSPSCIHADLWIPVKPGTDSALALSMAQVIIREKLYKEGFIKEQTDLPFLIRMDTQRFLRQKDVEKGGADDRFYCFDLSSNQIKIMPQHSLKLGKIDPALGGEYEVETIEGKKVRVRPVFQILKDRLEKDYVPEKASSICGVHPELIKMLAREVAQARAVTNISQFNFSKYYHGDLLERCAILLFALCGHFGKKGSGWNAFHPFLVPDSVEVLPFLNKAGEEGIEEFHQKMAVAAAEWKKKGYTDEMIIFERERRLYERKIFVVSTLFFYLNGLQQISGRSKEWDPYLKRELDSYMKESIDKGWQFVEPRPGKDPRIIFEWGGNFLRRIRGYPWLEKNLLPKLKLLVTVDSRMSHTAMHSDFILPEAWWYEKNDARYATLHAPFHSITRKVVEPLGESKPFWEIMSLLAKKIQERAKQRNIITFKDREGKERRLDTIYDSFSWGGYYGAEEDEKLLRDIYRFSTNVDVGWDEIKEKGWARYPRLGRLVWEQCEATDWKKDETITPYRWHTDKKMVWPTLTRRMQFYIDHELYLELGEELPVHKDNPPIGGDYPLHMTGGHTRWSVHTSWRDDAYMLRLQRGGPVMYMNPKDAQHRRIEDGDRVKVYNDVGSFEIHAKISSAVRPGQVIVYHAWEPCQFKDHKTYQSLTPSPINPVELAGGYFHLRPYFIAFNPGQSDRGTRVDVVKI